MSFLGIAPNNGAMSFFAVVKKAPPLAGELLSVSEAEGE